MVGVCAFALVTQQWPPPRERKAQPHQLKRSTTPRKNRHATFLWLRLKTSLPKAGNVLLTTVLLHRVLTVQTRLLLPHLPTGLMLLRAASLLPTLEAKNRSRCLSIQILYSPCSGFVQCVTPRLCTPILSCCVSTSGKVLATIE